jgi:3'-5' exoribonuclease
LKEGIWIREIAPNRRVAGVFLVKEKKALKGKTGKAYWLLKLTDRTGEVEARIWDRVEELGTRFQAGDLISISGDAISYQGSLQVRVADARGVRALATEDLSEFVAEYAEARQRSEERLAALGELVSGIQGDGLRTLVEAFLQEPRWREGWLMAPAAKKLHHARVGGLLEHTLSVCRLADLICSHYPHLQRDLLLAGAVLHDAAKIRELHSPWRPEYTTEGRLLGHVMMGVEMFEEKRSAIGSLPEEQVLALKHMIISHHGQFEYGSPRRPKTLEAMVLYMLDDLDAKFDAFNQHLLTDSGGEEGWTSYHSLFDRYLFRGPAGSPGIEKEEVVADEPKGPGDRTGTSGKER